jgi:hypothetical protein
MARILSSSASVSALLISLLSWPRRPQSSFTFSRQIMAHTVASLIVAMTSLIVAMRAAVSLLCCLNAESSTQSASELTTSSRPVKCQFLEPEKGEELSQCHRPYWLPSARRGLKKKERASPLWQTHTHCCKAFFFVPSRVAGRWLVCHGVCGECKAAISLRGAVWCVCILQ